jgi:putative endonuclease
MFYFIYILFSHKDNHLYVGCTKDIPARLKRHERGYVKATQLRLPIELIHQERFESKSEAFNRERFLKSLWGAREKKKILNQFLKSKN